MVKSNVTVTKEGGRVKATLNGAQTNGSTPASPPNGKEYTVDDGGMRMLTGLIERIQLAARAGLQFEGARDLYKIFGYKTVLTADDFLGKYQRQDIATRIIDAPPAATWSNPPLIENTALNTEWNALDRKVKLWNAMYRADRLARLNTFSLLLFGFDDTSNMQRPLNPEGVKELLYVRAVGARLIQELTFEDNVRSPRYGLPTVYNVQFDDPTTKSVSAGQISVKNQREMVVHHSRVVHVVENSLEDQVFGTPIMEKVYNLLDDLLKVAGGTSETYWLQGRGGIQADVDKEMEISPDDAAALSDEIDEYMHQLRRFIRTRGVNLEVLDTRVPNPKEVFNMIIALISGTTGIPKRILVGAEAGQLASEQDRANWAERIEERRSLFCEPIMLEPTVDLLQTSGLLSEGDAVFEWPSAFIQNPLEEGQTKAQTARAIGNISRQTGNKAPMQLTSREEARKIIGLEGDLDESEIIEQPEETPRIPPGGGAPPTLDPEDETTS
jgi:hypothetical protein